MSEPISFCERCGTHRDLLGPSDEDVFRRCSKCGLSVCPNCWNLVKGLCLADAPFELGTTSSRSRKVKPAALVAAAAAAASAVPLRKPSPSTSSDAPDLDGPAMDPVGGTGSPRTLRITVPRPHLALPSLPLRAILRGSTVLGLLCLTLVLGWQVVAFVGQPGQAPQGTPSAGDQATPRGAGGALFPATPSPAASPAVPAAPAPAAGGGQGSGSSTKDGSGGPAPTPHRTPSPPPATPSPQPTDVITPPPTAAPTPTPEPTPVPTPEPTPEPTPTDTPLP